jgi:uncharacterized protein YneF (UPF0154 family)
MKKWVKILLLVLLLIICFAIGYFIGVWDVILTIRSETGIEKLCEALLQ